MPKQTPTIFAIAPDKETAAFARRSLSRAGIDALFAHGEASAAALAAKIRGAGERAVVAVLDARFPAASLDAIRVCGTAGGLAVCVAEPSAPVADRDVRLLEQLWAQLGGICCPDLGTLVEMIRLHVFLGPNAAPRVRFAAPRSAVASRLGSLAARLGVLSTARGRTAAPAFEIAASGDAFMNAAGRRLPLPDPDASLRALGLLATRQLPDSAQTEPGVEVDSGVVDLIAKPPARILSEVASKRLVEAYGIALPAERLCGSPTESARFADELGAPVVLKLARPSTPNKSLLNAVRVGVVGAAQVRRAHHEIMRSGKGLGPPAPLGVLVSPEIVGGARIWIARERHPVLGLLVVGGPGDRRVDAPAFALAAPSTRAASRRALARLGLAADEAQLDALADTVARLSRLVAELGDRIDAAEIHPLVASHQGPALALDALIAVTG